MTPENQPASESAETEHSANLLDDFEAWVRERGGTTVPVEPSVGILPSRHFEPEDLPDVDEQPATVQTEHGPRITVPLLWAARMNDGIHLYAPEHVALMWVTASQEELVEEFALRQQEDLDMPPIVRRAVESGLEERR